MKKFLMNLKAVLSSLGLQAKFDKRELTAEEQKALIAAYNETHGADAFQNDFKTYEDEKKAQLEAESQSRMFEELATILGHENPDSSEESISQVIASVKELKETVEKLGAQSQGDTPHAQVTGVIKAFGPHSDKFAFGVQHPLFGLDKRYNRIAATHSINGEPSESDRLTLRSGISEYSEKLAARLQFHETNGTLQDVIKGEVDYSALTSDPEIGSRYLTVRMDALIARIMALPSLDGLFQKVSNVQSGLILTNVLFCETSQAYQAGRVFKGDVKFAPEKAVVDKVMAKIRFEDMSALETSYLQYLNTSGSDPVKWSMIEWIILKFSTVINNERNRRAVMGHYVAPQEGVAGPVLFGSTGIVHRLFGLYDEKKVLPFLGEDFRDYTSEDIGDVLILFAEELSKVRSDAESFTIYANAKHKPWFMKWYRDRYGKDTDYKGVSFVVPDYNIPIKWVPGMDNLKFIFATVADNILLLENVPGEEYRMQSQRDLEEVIMFSYWKEGAGIVYAGEQKETLADLKASDMENQLVFMNWPAVAVAADATTVDAKDGIIFLTAENTQATALTDIAKAKEGVVYRIECGSTTNATSIAKDGKFSELKSAWTPAAVGEYIKLYYDKKNDKFREIARG